MYSNSEPLILWTDIQKCIHLLPRSLSLRSIVNFVSVYKWYLIQREVFAITDYIGPSIDGLLQESMELLEPESPYVISQVNRGFASFYYANVVGFGQHSIYLVVQTRLGPYIGTRYPCLCKRRGQNQ
jgi:hypothetical protein